MLEVRVRYYIKALKERVYLRMCALAAVKESEIADKYSATRLHRRLCVCVCVCVRACACA